MPARPRAQAPPRPLPCSVQNTFGDRRRYRPRALRTRMARARCSRCPRCLEACARLCSARPRASVASSSAPAGDEGVHEQQMMAISSPLSDFLALWSSHCQVNMYPLIEYFAVPPRYSAEALSLCPSLAARKRTRQRCSASTAANCSARPVPANCSACPRSAGRMLTHVRSDQYRGAALRESGNPTFAQVIRRKPCSA